MPARTDAPQLARWNLKDRVASPEHAFEMRPRDKGRKVVCGCGTLPDCPPADSIIFQASEPPLCICCASPKFDSLVARLRLCVTSRGSRPDARVSSVMKSPAPLGDAVRFSKAISKRNSSA